MNLLLHIYAVCLGKIGRAPHIAYAIHQQISGYQKKVQKTAKNLFRLELRYFGTALKLTASKQPPLALLSGIFSNPIER